MTEIENNNKIIIQNLDLYYDTFHALKNINLNIEKNKITSFIGPSGCGKSTLLKSINRMNDLVENCKITGKILINFQNSKNHKSDEEFKNDFSLPNYKNILEKNIDLNELRKNVGMVFQKPNPFPMSIFNNIAFGPRAHGITKKSDLIEIVESSLQKAALWDEVKDKLKKSALALSGGQQQRLCIARALAVNPDTLLMDEPTSALDPISTSKIEDCIQELKRDLTIVIVTHNMQQAVRISDKTVFFLLGEIIEEGKTSQIFSMPKCKKTEDYITGRFG